MKWYKRQLKKILEEQNKIPNKSPGKALPTKKSIPAKIIHHGLEKRSRPKTDSK